MCYGGPVEPDEAGWMPHPDGHWFNFRDAEPAILIRMDTNPRLVRWRDIGGSQPSHAWRVPVLLQPVRDEVTGDVRLFVSALDRVWKGDGWDTPAEVSDLQRRILQIHHGLGTGRIRIDGPEAVAAALDILRLGFDFDDREIIAAGWVSEVLVVRTLLATVDMDVEA